MNTDRRRSHFAPVLSVKTWLAGTQWLLFMFANTVVIPVSVGSALHMDAVQIAGFMQRSFLLTGLVCLMQVLFGHGLPLLEGPSGVWWGVVLSVIAGAREAGISLAVAGGSLELGIILSGLSIMILGALGMGRVLRKWFTPVATSVFLILLATELISIFFRGMLGLTNGPEIVLPTAALSCMLVVVVLVVNVKGHRAIRNFAILIGIALGWIVYRLGLQPAPPTVAASFHSLGALFAWGPLAWQWGIVITAVLTGLINASNTVATLESVEPLFGVRPTDAMYRRSFLVTGFATLLSGIFGVVPYAPYTSSIGFLRGTQIYDRLPFVIGSALFVLLGLWGQAGAFFSTLPVSVGDAVLLVAYLQLFGSALQKLSGIVFTVRSIYRIALPTLLGIAVFTTPPGAFLSLPEAVRSFLGNGLLVGVAVAVVLENSVRWNALADSD